MRFVPKKPGPCRLAARPFSPAQGELYCTCTQAMTISRDVPSVKWLMASFLCGFCARNLSVTSGSPSLIMRCTMIKLLKTMVHVESRRRLVRARKISATPASPACVATRMCSTYLDLGAASYTAKSVDCNGASNVEATVNHGTLRRARTCLDLGAALYTLLKGAGHGLLGMLSR